MSVIVKTTTGNCDFILEQEYPDEAAAQVEEGKKITNATFLNLKVFNVKYIIPRALHEALFLIAISESRSRFTEPNNSLCAHASVQPVCTLSTCPSLTAMYTVLIISAAVHNTPYTEHF